LSVGDLQQWACTSKKVILQLDGAIVWQEIIKVALPQFDFSLEVLRFALEASPRSGRSRLMKLLSVLGDVVVPSCSQVIIRSNDEFQALESMTASAHQNAATHKKQGGQVATLCAVYLQFPDPTDEEGPHGRIWQSSPIHLQVTPQSIEGSGCHATFDFTWHRAELKMRASGLAPGLLIDIKSKDHAVGMSQRHMISSTSPTSFEPSTIGLAYFRKDEAAGKKALMDGILCVMYLRDAPPRAEFESARALSYFTSPRIAGMHRSGIPGIGSFLNIDAAPRCMGTGPIGSYLNIDAFVPPI
jgi:hypothetical protein